VELGGFEPPTFPISSGFEVFSQRYERGSIIVTSNLAFDEWTEVFGSERLTHHVHILEMNGESYRLRQCRERRRLSAAGSDSPSPQPQQPGPLHTPPSPQVVHCCCGAACRSSNWRTRPPFWSTQRGRFLGCRSQTGTAAAA